MEKSNCVEANDSEEDSDGKLKIVVESPQPKRKSPLRPTKSEKLIIESIEDEFERRLEEKAAKVKLNATHVKNIIRHVITNEHVLALVKKAENPNLPIEAPPSYEPKLTRAKARELLSTVPAQPIPWSNKKPDSEVQSLISDELPEDSDDDEYVPGAEDTGESESDRESSIFSDPPSVPPPTPPPPSPSPKKKRKEKKISYSEDGVFKIPEIKTKEDEKGGVMDEATIAKRTRSKLCLNDTPLEQIEEAFIPPDIPPDFYDMECDNEINDDWMDFLKTFTRPLEEVVKAPEDEEHDPEYNILGDEDISKIDKEELREELRIDKAVKITKKELNSLIDELLEYSDTYCSVEMNKLEQSFMADHPEECTEVIVNEESTIVAEHTLDPAEELFQISVDMNINQVVLLQQQMRQHVQLLTQNFILAYHNPEFHYYSSQLKEYLLNLLLLCDNKERSMFNAINLKNAVQLVNRWEALVATENEAVIKMKMHVSSTLAKMVDYKQMGNTYIPTFPTLIFDTIAKSDVFIYPSLLPKIPFKSAKMFKGITPFTNSEDNLIALGLEQFVSLSLFTRRGELQWKAACVLIHEHIMPYRDVNTIKNHIQKCKSYRCADNPIRYYFERKKAPTTVHYVTDLNQMKILPPCSREPAELPYQWKNFIYPNSTSVVPAVAPTQHQQVFNCHISTFTAPKTILPNTTNFTTSTPILLNLRKRKKTRVHAKAKLVYLDRSCKQKVDPITKFVKCLSRPSSIRKLLGLFMAEDKAEKSLEGSNETEKPHEPLQTPEQTPKPDSHVGCISQQQSFLECVGSLPSMPFLATPAKSDIHPDEKNQNESPQCSINTSQNEETVSTNQENSELEKDNLEDIQTLMAASSNTKAIRKEPSGAEKKKAKIRREFVANLAIAAPEDPEVERQKDEMFALAYYDKMRETLEMEDYHKIMQILNEHEADAVDLYHKVIKILRPKYEELAEEFLLFLREKEAAAVNELVPWIRMNNRSKFLRKLETYFKDQPAKLKKIYSLLVELSSTADVSMEMVKTKLMPFFKGNTILSDLFLLNFLSEKPPASLLEGPYESIDIDREINKTSSEEPYEVIKVPEVEDKYGCPSCICSCHEIEDPEFKTRYRHCIKCGTKFINGRVFIQSGRGLRPATVSFPMNPDKDHNVRLAGEVSNTLHKKRYELSPSKQIMESPTKENVEEETDDEKDGKKSKKTPRKRRQPTKRSNSRKDLQKLNNELKKQFEERSDSLSPTRAEYRQISKRPYKPKKTSVKKTVEKDEYDGEDKLPTKPGATPGQQKRFAEEASDNEGAQTPEELPCDQKPTSPEQNTAESESEFCEESSQDNCESDSNSSTSSLSQSDSNAEEHCWKREEDKIILETFQKENDKEVAFKSISHQIRNRSKSQIRKRFDRLMKILIETIGQSFQSQKQNGYKLDQISMKDGSFQIVSAQLMANT